MNCPICNEELDLYPSYKGLSGYCKKCNKEVVHLKKENKNENNRT